MISENGVKGLQKTATEFNRPGNTRFEGVKGYNRAFGGKIIAGAVLVGLVISGFGAVLDLFGGNGKENRSGNDRRRNRR